MASSEEIMEIPATKDESSDSESSTVTEDSRGDSTPIEWLATGRAKRCTAGNRMNSVLALEEPDSDLELLFAEDGDDAGFLDIDDEGSDLQMDSSSDSEGEKDGDADDLEGERELEKQAKERRTAQRKRKAQESIPAKFRKKVRINDKQPAKTQDSRQPAPRARKKSERTSWLPAATDLPTRASARQTTVLSKEQLHQQMMEREAKRLKQVEAMERKAKKMEATKKPPLTQAQRLAEAAIVEKRNAKSLNRWEEAEKAREEERRAKLAALNNRTLKGPVVTFWSGMGIWEGDENGGKAVSIEEKPKRKREKKDKEEKGTGTLTDDKAPVPDDTVITGPSPMSAANADAYHKTANSMSAMSGPGQPGIRTPEDASASTETQQAPGPMAPPAATSPSTAQASVFERPNSQLNVMGPPPLPSQPPKTCSPVLTPPSLAPPPQGLKAPVLAPPVLAPPPGGIHLPGSSMTPMSTVLAPPNAIQRPSPLSPHSIKQSEERPPLPRPVVPNSHSASLSVQPIPPEATPPTDNPSRSPTSQPPSDSVTAPASEPKPPAGPPGEPSVGSKTSKPSKTTRHAIILQNFDETLIRDKTSQLQVLFGQRKLSKLPKPPPAPLCAITNHPARYRDPRTGLPYFNSYAYREIQRLRRGDYRFSSLIGAWVGSGSYAAQGVPARFLGGSGMDKKQDAGTKDTLATHSASGNGRTEARSENKEKIEGGSTMGKVSSEGLKKEVSVGEISEPQDRPVATLAVKDRVPTDQVSRAAVVPGAWRVLD
ncbi:YL1-domain-containing protein [Sodiomyces alkalinus F11]|uniref:YL1-domain-containing protein n=1 Tax=Sodiomyces alkalinus (strain CBS 110278 / VKM F-3762 / F11) TaxID=1314773 RepID=A0A3N2Q0F3_SODAK|nr:YL1-domain-containing protein [Sodiomyces alkalinus F11]ROT40166.1 YL1-domain-containing protein [Sodiomyces alkalinus F11]